VLELQLLISPLQLQPDSQEKTYQHLETYHNRRDERPVGQAAAIKQLLSEYGNKLNVLVIDLWAPQNIVQSAQGLNAETANDVQAFIAKNGSPQWNAALDTGGVTIKYGTTQVDSTVVVDGNGNIVFKNFGPSGYQPLNDALAKDVI
jgi:hypothetical protein